MNGKDREQFREFMESRWPGLVRLGYALTGDRWLAEDLAQTALASACNAWWRVRRADDPDAYVRRILINASNSHFRRRSPPVCACGLREVPLPDPAALAGQRSDLMAALRGLPPRQRAVIVLRYWGDLSVAECAQVMGVSIGSVNQHLARARAALQSGGDITVAEGLA